MDDDALTARLAADLDGAFEALVLSHQDRVYTIALRLLGDPGEAEEVAQDAFLRAYRALAGYEPARRRELRLRPWLATIVLNQSRNRRRGTAERRRPIRLATIVDTHAEPSDEGTPSPDAVSLAMETAAAWAGRLLRCPPAQRAAVVLRHVDGLSYEEIATVLDRPVGTIKAQVHRGLANLRAQLDREQAKTPEELSA